MVGIVEYCWKLELKARFPIQKGTQIDPLVAVDSGSGITVWGLNNRAKNAGYGVELPLSPIGVSASWDSGRYSKSEGGSSILLTWKLLIEVY